MVSFNTYLPLPAAPPETPPPLLAKPCGSENLQIPYHLNVVQAKR